MRKFGFVSEQASKAILTVIVLVIKLRECIVSSVITMTFEDQGALNVHEIWQDSLRADLILAFKIFKGGVNQSLSAFFLRGHTYRLLQGPSRLRCRSDAFSVRVVKY